MLSSCATTTSPQQFRRYFVPPVKAAAASAEIAEPPKLMAMYYANEAPHLTDNLPPIARPTDTEFLIKRADDRFAAGKKAYQDGRIEDGRREFNHAIDLLLAAPDNLPDRARLERRLEELIDSIYRYDADQSAAQDPDEERAYDKRPLDDILEMTFPVDPNLRNKVKEQVQATVSQLPLQESDAVVSFINFFSSTRGKRILAGGLKRSGRYKPMIDRILDQEGVPRELIFVAQAESGFMPRAVSNKLCVGVWQFAKFRGQEYGLEVTPAADDRMDPEKATRAAAHHLHDLYSHFGDWYLALAAYNCGPNCVDRAVQRTGYADFWELRRRNALPLQTANYVPAILAMTIVAKNAQDYGLEDVEFDRPLEYDTMELQSPTHLALVAAAVDHPVSELRELNPGLLRTVAPAGYQLRLPKGSSRQVAAAFEVIPANRRDAWRIHRVEDGDSFATLAKRYGSQPSLIGSINHDEMPEAGAFAAIPVSYPGDPKPVRKTSARRGAHGAVQQASAATPSRKRTVTTRRPAPKRVVASASSKSAHRRKSGT